MFPREMIDPEWTTESSVGGRIQEGHTVVRGLQLRHDVEIPAGKITREAEEAFLLILLILILAITILVSSLWEESSFQSRIVRIIPETDQETARELVCEHTSESSVIETSTSEPDPAVLGLPVEMDSVLEILGREPESHGLTPFPLNTDRPFMDP